VTSITIMGAGVVGSATGKGFARHGHGVSFVDIDASRIANLRREGFAVSDTVVLGDEPSIIFLTLPTPNNGYRWDLDYLKAGTRTVGEALRASTVMHTVVVRSTVPPGTCDEIVRPILEEATDRPVNEGFALASNPEFLRARSAFEDFLSPRMTVIGSHSPRTLERLEDLLRPFGGELRRYPDPRTVELIKCTHNLYNATKISFWNELWEVSERLGLNPAAIADTVALSSEASYNTGYGISGGTPYGGACLPKDTKGFLGFAAALGIDVPMASATDQVNERLLALATAAVPEQADRLVRAREQEVRNQSLRPNPSLDYQSAERLHPSLDDQSAELSPNPSLDYQSAEHDEELAAR
jgi:UDPglucose 6-dehydrogenase